MRSFKEYLTESQKTYAFKVKVAGPVPEKFVENTKARLAKYGCSKFEQTSTTPIQATPLDFPELCNVEVTMFEAECSYPVTPPELLMAIRSSVAISETHIRVRNFREAEELEAIDSLVGDAAEKKKTALLNDPAYKEAEKVKSKNYFGDDFNKALLKDLQKTAKQRKKELGQKDVKTEITSDGPDFGAASNSIIGSSKGK